MLPQALKLLALALIGSTTLAERIQVAMSTQSDNVVYSVFEGAWCARVTLVSCVLWRRPPTYSRAPFAPPPR